MKAAYKEKQKAVLQGWLKIRHERENTWSVAASMVELLFYLGPHLYRPSQTKL